MIQMPLCHCDKPFCKAVHSSYAPEPEITHLWGRSKITGMWEKLRTCYKDTAEKWLEIWDKDPTTHFRYCELKLSKKRPPYAKRKTS